jgi:hypothetical protein
MYIYRSLDLFTFLFGLCYFVGLDHLRLFNIEVAHGLGKVGQLTVILANAPPPMNQGLSRGIIV